jgi:hypothetical protein
MSDINNNLDFSFDLSNGSIKAFENLHDWRERRNRLIHRKHTFKDDKELNDFAREIWLIGTFIIYDFVDSIADIPYI